MEICVRILIREKAVVLDILYVRVTNNVPRRAYHKLAQTMKDRVAQRTQYCKPKKAIKLANSNVMELDLVSECM